MTGFAALDAELDQWGRAGRVAMFWWRDDDAGVDSPAFGRLLALAAKHDAALALAVIPLKLDAAARARIEATPQACVLQHGLRHDNRAAADEKKCEFPARLPLDAMLAELDQGHARLGAAFAGRALPVLVPPWNRLAPRLIPVLPSIGLRGLSTYRARKAADAAPGLRQVNCHVDLIDWRSTRGFLGEAAALALACDHLRARREGRADPNEPTGILTHHAVHDEPAWRFLDDLLGRLARHPAARLEAAATLFPVG